MDLLSESFGQTSSQETKVKQEVGEFLGDVRSMLRKISKAVPMSELSDGSKELELSVRINLRPNGNVTELAMAMNLLNLGQYRANLFATVLNNNPKLSEKEKAQNRLAARLLHRDTVDFLEDAGLVGNGTAAKTAHEILLTEFFDWCHFPNDAEFAALGKLIRWGEDFVRSWFEEQRQKRVVYYATYNTIMNELKVKVGAVNRKRRREDEMVASSSKRPRTL